MSDTNMLKVQIVHPKSQVEDQTCPYCLDQFEVGQAVVVCPNPKCGMIHHVEHWEENNNECASSYGCDGAGEIDWLNPLHVKESSTIDATPAPDPLSGQAANLLGLQASRLQNIPLFAALFSEAPAAYKLALTQFVLVTILVIVSKGQVTQNPLFHWQNQLVSQIWPWMLAWTIITIISSYLIVLSGKPRLLIIMQFMRLLSGILIWLFISLSFVEFFFIPQYLWPDGIGNMFLFFGWGRIVLFIAISVVILYGLIMALLKAASMPNIVLATLGLSMLDFLPIFIGAIGMGLIAWGGIGIGAHLIAWISGVNLFPTLLYNGLATLANVSFPLLILIMTYLEIVNIVRQAIANKKQQKERTNA